MELDRRAREFVHFPILEVPEGGTLDISFDRGETWHPLTVEGGDARVLVAGPDAEGNIPGTVVLSAGRSTVTIRSTAFPEDLYRDGGVIDIV